MQQKCMYDIVIFPFPLTMDGAFFLHLGAGEVLIKTKILIVRKKTGEIPKGL